jgi:hypothetical protein
LHKTGVHLFICITIPGLQYPHWVPWKAANRACFQIYCLNTHFIITYKDKSHTTKLSIIVLVVRVLIGKTGFIDGNPESIKHFKLKKSKDVLK